jgi:hypothetical protein
MSISLMRNVAAVVSCAVWLWCVSASAEDSEWQDEFGASKCSLKTSGRSEYFVLEPGYQMLLEGPATRLHVTVLDETKAIDGVTTRVVEEREWKKGELYEVARNYYAFCEETEDILYFGEDVDYYERGKVVRHDGSWIAENSNRPGLLIAGAPRPHMKYYKEIAPGVAVDRDEVVSLVETCITPAGVFSHCMKIRETSELQPSLREYKWYAPGIGLVVDDTVRLVKYGKSSDNRPLQPRAHAQ